MVASYVVFSYHTLFFFFFSSRRRHTRYWRDWSSDVCSSDLADVARDILQPDAVAAAAEDLAIGEADIAAAQAMHEATPRRQRNAAAIERESAQADAACAFTGEHAGAAGEDQFCRAAHADQLRGSGKFQHAGTVNARRQCERHLRARSFVDRALQRAGLVVGTAGPYAV